MVKHNSSLIFGLGEKDWEGKLREGKEGCAQLQNQHSLLIFKMARNVWQIKAQNPRSMLANFFLILHQNLMVRMFLSKLQCEQLDCCGAPVPPCCPRLFSMLWTAWVSASEDEMRWDASLSQVWLCYQCYFSFPQGVWHKTLHADFPSEDPSWPQNLLRSLHHFTEWLPWFLLAFNWSRFKRNCALCPEKGFSECIPNRLWPSQSSGSQHLKSFLKGTTGPWPWVNHTIKGPEASL